MEFFLGDVVSQRSVIYVTLALLHFGGLCIYRLFLHPLARVPGPSLAACTKLYQTYYSRKYFEQIGILHDVYGPVVRICPNEIHLADPANYDRIYHVGSTYTKDPVYYDLTNVPLSTFGAVDHEVHRIRRSALNPMFSRKMVTYLEPVIQEKVQTFCTRVQEALDRNVPFDLHHGFRAVSTDVASHYAFDKSFNLLDHEDLGATFHGHVTGVGPSIWMFQLSTILREIAMALPESLVTSCSSSLKAVYHLRDSFAREIDAIRERLQHQGRPERPTIFTTLLDPEVKPAGFVPPSTPALTDEAFSIIFAGSDTSGNAMTVAAFHTLRTPEIYARLTSELMARFPDVNVPLAYTDLEPLPYLSAVIKEALRLSFGVPGRLPRVVPEPGATFNGYFVPAGTIVGMSSWTMHRDSQVFPDPMRFDPERWLELGAVRHLDRNMVPFSKGTRQCGGMQLAYAELYVTLGTFFRRFPNLKVYKTEPRDMEYVDAISAYHVRGRNWLKAVSAECYHKDPVQPA